MAGSFLALITIAGIISGVAITIALFRRRGGRNFNHNCAECVECREGFLCETAMTEHKRAA